jgi:hypothetical protein
MARVNQHGTYDGPALLSSPDTGATDARGSPSGREAGSWVSPISVARDVVAANTAPRLSLDRIRVTSGGVDAVEAHLGRFPSAGEGLGSAEAGMVARLRGIASGDLAPAAQDLRFYAHELRESVLYRQSGHPTGQPAGDVAYDLWDVLHTQALADYGFPRSIAPDFRYHPSAIGR